MTGGNFAMNLLRSVEVTDRSGELHSIPAWLVRAIERDPTHKADGTWVWVAGSPVPLHLRGSQAEWIECLRHGGDIPAASINQ